MVTRFNPELLWDNDDVDPEAVMKPDRFGGYIEVDEYAELEERYSELENERDNLQDKLNAIRDIV